MRAREKHKREKRDCSSLLCLPLNWEALFIACRASQLQLYNLEIYGKGRVVTPDARISRSENGQIGLSQNESIKTKKERNKNKYGLAHASAARCTLLVLVRRVWLTRPITYKS